MGILSGLATSLGPEFDPWAETTPFAEQIASEEVGGLLEGLEELLHQVTPLVRLPAGLERFLEQAERGTPSVKTSLAPEGRTLLVRGEEGLLAEVLLGLAFLTGLYGFLHHR